MMKFTPQESLNIAGAFIACALVSILAFITWALVYRAIPNSNNNSLTLLIGILSSNVGMVVGYFFGSSVNNKKQTEAIAAMAETAKTAGTALTADTGTINLKPGEVATATASTSGTVIDKEPAP